MTESQHVQVEIPPQDYRGLCALLDAFARRVFGRQGPADAGTVRHEEEQEPAEEGAGWPRDTGTRYRLEHGPMVARLHHGYTRWNPLEESWDAGLYLSLDSERKICITAIGGGPEFTEIDLGTEGMTAAETAQLVALLEDVATA